MPTFTIYSLGDVSSFWTMLNGIAMFFNDNGFIQSAALCGSLVMLVLMLVNVLAKTGGGSGGQSPVLGPLYLGATFLFMSIPTSVVLEDIYTGSIIKVDNIPLIISLPSTMFTTGAYKIFKSADTVFQSVNGSYMSVSTNGLVTPMKLLMSMRKGLTGEAPILAMNIKVFVMDCTTNSPTFDRTKLEAAPDAMDYLLTHENPTGLTFDFPAGSSTPVATNCHAEAAILKSRLDTFLGGAVLTEGDVNKIINKNMSSMLKPDKTSYNFTTDATLPVQNLVTSQLGTSSQNAQQLMSNLIMYDTINLGLDCVGVPTEAAAASACWTAVAAERQAAEQWKSDAAGAGSMFTKLMVPAITFMQLMFYGFSPLILIFALFAGEKSIGLVGKYMMFGIWTVSWLPFAAVIQMYIQNQVIDRVNLLGKLSPNGITLSNTPDFYDMVSTNLSLASDLLAATPMISFALLSGSAMAMTSMAGRWGGRDYTDEKAMSPDAMKTGAINSHAPAHETNQYGGNAGGYTAPSLSLTGSSSSAESSAMGKAKSAMEAQQASYAIMDKAASSQSDSFSWDKGAAERYTTARANDQNSKQSLANSFSQEVGDSSDKSGAVGVDVAAKIGAGMTVGAALKGANSDTIRKAEAWASKHGDEISLSQSQNKTLASEASASAKYAESHSNQTGREAAKSIGDSITKSVAATESYNNQASSGFAYNAGLSGKVTDLASQLSRPGSSTESMMNAMETGYSGSVAYAEFAPEARSIAADMILNGVPKDVAMKAGMLMAIGNAANANNQNAINTMNGLSNAMGMRGISGNASSSSGIAAIVNSPNVGSVNAAAGGVIPEGDTPANRAALQAAERNAEAAHVNVGRSEIGNTNSRFSKDAGNSGLSGPLGMTGDGQKVSDAKGVVEGMRQPMDAQYTNNDNLDLVARATGTGRNATGAKDLIEKKAADAANLIPVHDFSSDAAGGNSGGGEFG